MIVSAERCSRSDVDRAGKNGRKHKVASPDFDVRQRTGSLRRRDYSAADERRLDHWYVNLIIIKLVNLYFT